MSNLTACERLELIRHKDRPTVNDYIPAMFTRFMEFHGDRLFGDDAAIIGGIGYLSDTPVTVIAQVKGRNLEENKRTNFSMPHPEGYRKALRLMKQAEKFRRPIFTFIDTAGAYPGLEAEEHGQGEAIARNLFEMSRLTVPVIAVVTGEGNSGGALVNAKGELVGINTLIQSRSGTYIGYAFAVPTSIVKKVVVDLKEYGIVQRALLGIRYGIVDQDFIDNMGEETGIKELGGAYVSSVVEGGSASEAGIRKGDVILDIDGVKINDNATLSEQIGRRRPNDKVKLSVKRDGKVKQIDVTLRNKAGKTELITKEDVDMVEVLGGKFADAGAKLCRELDIKGGVQVVGIKADGILARARVKQGFVITHINDRPVYSLSDMERMTDKVRSIDGIYPNGRAASYVLVE